MMLKASAIAILWLLAVSIALAGLVVSTKAASLPSYVIYSVPITLTNQQSTATPSPFQQMIIVNSAQFTSYEASNLQNVAFFYSNGTIIPSWLESGDSNSATSSVYWLRLAGGIPASLSITVYMGFASTSTNLFNSQMTGEAPDLSYPVGNYDDGDNVFLVYSDFDLGFGSWIPYSSAGNFVPTHTSNGVEMIDNGGSGERTFLIPQSGIPEIPIIVEYSWDYSGGADGTSVSVFGKSPISSGLDSSWDWNTSNCPMIGAVCAGYWFYNSQSYMGQSIVGDNTVATGGFPGQGSFNIVSELTMESATTATVGYLQGTLSLDNFSGRPVPALIRGSVPNSFNNPTLMLFGWAGQVSAYIHAHWIVARAYPPNGVMPSVTVGSPTTQTSSSTSASTVTTTLPAVTTIATVTSTKTIVSTTALPVVTGTQVASTTNSTTNSTTPPPSLSPSVLYALGAVLAIFVAFVFVRVVFWRRISEWLNKGV